MTKAIIFIVSFAAGIMLGHYQAEQWVGGKYQQQLSKAKVCLGE